jgi:hypothetical protein
MERLQLHIKVANIYWALFTHSNLTRLREVITAAKGHTAQVIKQGFEPKSWLSSLGLFSKSQEEDPYKAPLPLTPTQGS